MDDYNFFTLIKNITIFKHILFANVGYHLLTIHLKNHTSYVHLVHTLEIVEVQMPRSHIHSVISYVWIQSVIYHGNVMVICYKSQNFEWNKLHPMNSVIKYKIWWLIKQSNCNPVRKQPLGHIFFKLNFFLIE